MYWICLECNHENESEDFLFGDNVTCEECGAEHETDWEYLDLVNGAMAFWVTGRAKKQLTQ